jgi:pyridoxine 5-phosphate synthase
MAGALLSVNINKYALLRNSRGHNNPDLLWAIDTALAAGAHGITVHPRRDQRHIRFDDVPAVAKHLTAHHAGVELNIECENAPELVEMVLAIHPAQCTLVPVTPGEVTSDHGWDLVRDGATLEPTIHRLRAAGIRVSLFADCNPNEVHRFASVGANRIELYTGPYAWSWGTADEENQTNLLRETAAAAAEVALGVNAGHDLDRHNLAGIRDVPNLLEVSIGHAQICRALEVGTTQAIRELLTALGHEHGSS